jgi:hypothetical protein
MNEVQKPPVSPAPDRRLTQPQRTELTGRDNSTLPARNLRDPNRPEFA